LICNLALCYNAKLNASKKVSKKKKTKEYGNNLQSNFRIWVYWLLFSFIFGINSFASGQTLKSQPFSQQFTVDEGLPSNEVYHVIQDSFGYIWIATANGVSQFDGNNFRNWGVDDGILESSIHELYIDYQGRIWFISGSGNLVYYQNETIKTYPSNYKIKENTSS